MKEYAIAQFRKYLLKQDSFGDALYNLCETNIDEAQHEKYECPECGAEHLDNGDICEECGHAELTKLRA